MRQRREDARNIALIAGSGMLGAVAALVGVSLLGSSAEVQDPASASKLTGLRADRYRMEISYRVREHPVGLHYVRRSDARLNEGARIRAIDVVAAPVVYVDGVRFDGPVEDLSPDDIESVDVIKGDAAIEQYGKEGENGVIIIKKRKPGKKRKGGGPP